MFLFATMQTIDIQQRLRDLNQSYYSIADLGKILNQRGATLRVTIHRLVEKGILVSIQRGAYTLPEQIGKLDRSISQMYYPCYLSLETALARYTILNQIPYTLTFVSDRVSKRLYVGEQEVEIRQIHKNLFWGYTLKNGLAIAHPEKALLDQLYYVSLGKASLDWDELNLHEVSKKTFLGWAKKFPAPTQKLARELADRFGIISVTVQ